MSEYALLPYTLFVIPSHECQCKFVFEKFTTLFDTFSFQHDLNLSHRTYATGKYDFSKAVNFSTVECCV